MAFTCYRIVRFGECDPAGVLYYPVYFDWTHQCMEAWFEDALEIPYSQALKTHGFPSKMASFQYHSPCRNGETIRMAFALKELRRRSFEIDLKLFGEDDVLRAHGQVVCVCIGVEGSAFEFQPTAIPSDWHARMSEFLLE